MSGGPAREQVLVIGAGVIGLSIARLLAKGGRAVTVLDAHPEAQKSTWAAAGMLSPLGETGGDPDFLHLGQESLARYPGWITELREEGFDVPFRTSGRLDLALNPEEADRLRRTVEMHQSENPDVEWLSARRVALQDPALVPTMGAAWFPRDAWVDPRALLGALRASSLRHGVRIREGVQATEVSEAGSKLRVRTGSDVRAGSDPSLLADWVIVAAGAWSGGIEGLLTAGPVIPVRGDMLALESLRAGPRSLLHTPDVYVVPRPDRTLVGASMMREGFDHQPRADVIRRLRRDAEGLCPALARAAELERWAGVRPGTEDGLPLLGADPARPHLLYATGHFRNGILLAPLTAECIEAGVDGRPPPLPLHAFAPDRFSAQTSVKPGPAVAQTSVTKPGAQTSAADQPDGP